MVDRRELMAGAVGMGAMTIFPGGGDGGDGEIAQLRAELAALKREVRQLQRQFPRGLKIRPRPDGTLALGDVPLTIEDNGLHFKDQGAVGDGLFWDGNTKEASIQGYSTAPLAYLLFAAGGTVSNSSIAMFGNGQIALAAPGNFIQIDPTLRLGAYTSDPTSPVNGDIWYRSDTAQIRVRLGATTYSINVTAV